jgi:hypothetical protein
MTTCAMTATNWPFWPRTHRLLECSLTILAVLLSLSVLASATPSAHADNVKASVSISPAMQVAYMIRQSFNFYVNVYDVENLSTVSFTLAYNASNLEFCEVKQLSFFPPPPASNFQYEAIGSLGVLNVNISLVGSQPQLSGNGTLVYVRFEVIQNPASSIASTIIFKQVSFGDGSGKTIPCDSNGAVCFWQSYAPDPPGDGLLTEAVNNAVFLTGQLVILTSQVTYQGAPVVNKLVAFQILDPTGSTVTIGVAITDKNGFATISFRIPDISTSFGEWTSFSTVDLDQRILWDIAYFQVGMPRPTVGGTSFSLKTGGKAVASPAPLVASLLISTLAFAIHKQTRRKSNHS